MVWVRHVLVYNEADSFVDFLGLAVLVVELEDECVAADAVAKVGVKGDVRGVDAGVDDVIATLRR